MTRRGRLMASAGPTLLVVGLMLAWPEVTACGAACISLLALAAAWAGWSSQVAGSISVRPARIGEGERSEATLVVTNPGGRRSLPFVASVTVGESTRHITIPSLGTGATHESRLALPAFARGVHRIGPVHLAPADPLGLITRVGRVSPPTRLVVHPSRHQLLPAAAGSSPDAGGPTSDAGRRGGVAFDSLRDYEIGDDLRLVHWKATARAGTLLVRENAVPRDPWLTLMLDTSVASYAVGGRFEDAIRVAASVCASVGPAQPPLYLRTTGGTSIDGSATGGAVALMDALAEVTPTGEQLGPGFLRDLAVSERGGSFVIVTGEHGIGRAPLAAARHWFDRVTVVQLADNPGRFVRDGILTVRAPTSAEVAVLWNDEAHR